MLSFLEFPLIPTNGIIEKEKKGKEGKERKGKQRKGREGKERKGKERKGEERKGKEILLYSNGNIYCRFPLL